MAILKDLSEEDFNQLDLTRSERRRFLNELFELFPDNHPQWWENHPALPRVGFFPAPADLPANLIPPPPPLQRQVARRLVLQGGRTRRRRGGAPKKANRMPKPVPSTSRRRRRSRKQRGGVWGPAPLPPLPPMPPFVGTPHFQFAPDRPVNGWIARKFAVNDAAINRIISAINDCHPGGCPAVAVPVQFPVANPMPPLPPGPAPPAPLVLAPPPGGWDRAFRRRVRPRLEARRCGCGQRGPHRTACPLSGLGGNGGVPSPGFLPGWSDADEDDQYAGAGAGAGAGADADAAMDDAGGAGAGAGAGAAPNNRMRSAYEAAKRGGRRRKKKRKSRRKRRKN